MGRISANWRVSIIDETDISKGENDGKLYECSYSVRVDR